MGDAFTGDSDTKKIARRVFWGDVRDELGERFARERFLVLGGEDAGDVATLLGMGVSPSSIVAVEIDRARFAKATARHPNVSWVCGDVGDVAKRVGRVGAALLDFCGHPGDRQIDALKSVVEHCMSDGSVVGHAFSYGKDGPLMPGFGSSAARVAQASSVGERITGLKLGAILMKLTKHTVKGRCFLAVDTMKMTADCDGRSAFVFEQLFRHGLRNRVLTCKFHETRYVGHRMPMLLIGRAVYRRHPATPVGTFRRTWQSWVEARYREGRIASHTRIRKSSGAALAIALDEWSPDELNLTVGRAAALKAHLSRGSYGDIASLIKRQTGAVAVWDLNAVIGVGEVAADFAAVLRSLPVPDRVVFEGFRAEEEGVMAVLVTAVMGADVASRHAS